MVLFRILGPLTVTTAGRPVQLGGLKQRLLLAHLLLNAGRPVAPGRLADVLWGDVPPASAAANLQTYVWRLRRCLPELAEERRLLTRGVNYALAVAPGELDAQVFAERRAEAAAARREGDLPGALGLLREAERLWQGHPLEDLPVVPAWEAELGRLNEDRLAVVEERLGLQVRLGQHDAAIAELGALLVEHPYRELLWQHYLVALDAAGRRADALAAYGTVRERLAGDLGVEPGQGLREVQAAILRGEPAGRDRGPGEKARVADGVRQLPADIRDFTGREHVVAELEKALEPRPGAGAAPLAVVSGPPGTGKSALALHVAHRLRAEFPDGQLYADLAATSDSPGDPADVLADFLHALGVVGAALPAGLTARSALFRSRLAGRRMFVLLDDAGSVAQVRPLLPADGGCAVLVTTRGRLPELPGVHPVELREFAAAEAGRLLAGIAGEERVAAEPENAAEIVEFCGYLPLAIRIAGARLAGRQAWTLGVLRDRLADESGRLSELRAGDLAIRSSFELSLRQLPADAVRAFGRLALTGVREFPAWVLDALLDGPAHEVLDVLVDANLVAAVGTGVDRQPQYRLHDLLRCYAAEVLDAESAADQSAALARTLGALISLTKHAAAALPRAFGAMTGPPIGWTLDPRAEQRLVAEPLAWFVAQRAALSRGVELAVSAGLPEPAWQLAAAAVPFYDLRGHYDDWRRGHQHALTAVREAGDLAGEAVLLRGLGQVHLYHDEYEDAERTMSRAMELFVVLGDRQGEALARAGLGTLARFNARPADALGHYRRALDGLIAVGDRSGEAQMRISLGSSHLMLGQFDEAAGRLGEALAVARAIDDPHRQAKVLTELGTLHRETGAFADSLTALRTALAVLEQLKDERCTAYALLGIGQTLLAAGEPAPAGGVGERALDFFRRTGNRQGEGAALALLEQSRRSRRRNGRGTGVPARL